MTNYSIRKICLASLLSINFCYAQRSAESNIENERVVPFQVFDNLYYVGSKSVSVWLLESDQGLILFDSLYGELTNMAIDSIRGLGFDPDDIRYLIVSHAHYDRVGGARKFQDEFGAVVMMTEEDWSMTEALLNDEEYPKPIRHLAASDGSTLNLGRTRLRFFQTPGVTPGVLSTRFTVYDNGYPHSAFIFGGSDLDYLGAEQAELYISSVRRIMQLEGIEVNIPTRPESGDVFARYETLQDRREGDPHPFVDPESWAAWLDLLLLGARAKLENYLDSH